MKIVQHLFDSSKTDQVCFSRSGDSFTELRNNGMNVVYSVRIVGEKHFRVYSNINATHDTGFSRTATRMYLRADGEGTVREQEALLGNITSNSISRISTRGKEEALRSAIDVSCLTCLRASLDGRYIAYGNGDGQFELWNMDMAPHKIFSYGFDEPTSIADMCFSRTNLELLVSTTSGTTHLFDLHRDEVRTLSAEDGWPCYSIDVQTDGDGIVFAGEEGMLWMLDVKGATLPNNVSVEDVPFRLEQARTVTGTTYWRVAAKPRSSVSCIRTTVGSYATQVRFLRDDLICVLGERATEIWSLDGDEPRQVLRQSHDRDARPLSFGGTPELVRVALGRAI